MNALLAACAAALAMSAPAPQDAPAPLAPAVRAEIHRGADAAYVCYVRFSGLDQTADFAGCVRQAGADAHQQAGSDDDAFDAGLYFRAAQFIRLKVELLQQNDPASSTIGALTSVLGPLAAASDAAEAKLHLDDSVLSGIFEAQ